MQQERRLRIFISYKRNASPDDQVVSAVVQALEPFCEVFIDVKMGVGVAWAERIEAELRHTDFLIPFLSQYSVHSEMVLAEIETAHHLAKENNGMPRILPVRVAYDEPFVYPLSAYLNRLNWAIWHTDNDTSTLIDQLREAIEGGKLATPPVPSTTSQPTSGVPIPQAAAQPPLEHPEGTMPADAAYYIERPTDAEALKAISGQGVTLTIKGPRQIGKSSLLMRIIDAAAKQGKHTLYLDFQMFDKSSYQNGENFFHQFAVLLSYKLGLENRTEDYWKLPLSNLIRCSDYVENYVLKTLNVPLLLAMDEVERIFGVPFQSDFFSMLRAWHNNRASNSTWAALDLALVTSTEPFAFIEDLNQSPFNVGVVLPLRDFSLEQVNELNTLHGVPLSTKETQQLYRLTSGHPYLVRRALYLVASQQITPDYLFAEAARLEGPFGDHLRNLLYRLRGRDELVQGLREIIRYHRCQDQLVYFRLSGAGLVVHGASVHQVSMRCTLYYEFLDANLP